MTWMNFVGHIATGLRVGSLHAEPQFLVGTALPDFAGMGRTRLGAANGPLGAGIALHHATDRVFHAAPWFLDFERELRSQLREDGLPDGGARACAHVGPELLLDGALLDDPTIASGVRTVYSQMAPPDDDVLDLVLDGETDRWRAHLVGVVTHLDPAQYDNPGTVARRLHRMTSRRPRLAFDGELVESVCARMVAVQPRIRSSATELLNFVVRGVAR